MMTSRERVTAAIEFASPDLVPFTHVLFAGALWRHGSKLVDLMARYPDDFGNRNFTIPLEPAEETIDYTDEWGSRWRRRRDYSAGEVIAPALDSWDKWPSFAFPADPPAAAFTSYKDSLVGHDWYELSGWFDLYERMQYLRGTENILCDIAEDRAEIYELADRLVERNLRLIDRHLECGIDGLWLSDDWGTQNGLLISPDRWRAIFKPRYRRLIEPIKNAGVHVFFHSCGWTEAIWDDLIELGVDAINIQTPLMPPDLVREKLTGRICIFTDVDRQRIMPFGTPQQVRAHIRDLIALCGTPTGGVMLRGELEAVWPYENIEAMYQAYAEFR